MKRSASESVKNGYLNLERLNRSFRLAQPGISPLERLWFRRRTFHVPNRMHKLYICYLPAGRSVLGKTVPEILNTARGRRPRAVFKTSGTVFPNTDRPRPANNIYIIYAFGSAQEKFGVWIKAVEYFVSSFCVEFSLQPFSNLVYACVWHLGNRKSDQHYTHWRELRNCLFLRSLFTFYVLCSEKKNCWKRRESWKIKSGPYAGSGWENPDRCSARN